jgi:hypothetical protein
MIKTPSPHPVVTICHKFEPPPFDMTTELKVQKPRTRNGVALVSHSARKHILKRPANLWTLYLSSHRGSGVPLAVESRRLRTLYKELLADSPEMIRLKELYNANKEAYQLKKKGLGTSEKILLKRYKKQRRAQRGSGPTRPVNSFCCFVKEHKEVLKEKGIAEGGKILKWRTLESPQRRRKAKI